MLRRRFFVAGHTQTTDPTFPFDDLPGAAGRLDVLARAVTSALCMSHGVRDDTEIWTVIDRADGSPARTLVWHGDRVRHLNPDERTTAALFRKAFAADVIDMMDEVHPGLEAADWGFEAALRAFCQEGDAVVLDRPGTDLRTAPDEVVMGTGARPAGFVLSDHRPFRPEEETLLHEVAEGRISLGPHWLHGHHAVTIVHDEIDRRGLARSDDGP